MSAKYRRNGRWTIRVPHPEGGSVEKSIGTKDTNVAKSYEAMCQVLLARPLDRAFLTAVCEGSLKIKRLYDHYLLGTLDTLREELKDTDLTEYLADWKASLITQFGDPDTAEGKSSHTVTQYTKQVANFFDHAGGATLSRYDVAHASKWLHSRPVSSARKRRFWASLRSFGLYLRSVGVLPSTAEPLAGLKSPPPGKARDIHLTAADRDRLIKAMIGVEMQAAQAMAHIGMEQGAIVRAKVRDIEWVENNPNFAARIRMRGTKNRFRDRIGVVEHWAAPYLRAAIKGKLPDALVVGVSTSRLRQTHLEACAAIGLEGYRFHDARHTFAVLWKQRGVPSAVIGLQLGHADGRTVEKVYGLSQVTVQQLEYWAGVVAQNDNQTATNPATSSKVNGL